MEGALSGYRVVELTSTVSGPYAGMVLGDQGADVIKIEPPGIGDLARFMGDARNGMAAMYATLNRNKRSVVLDLKRDSDLVAFRKLAASADVLIENYRPGVVAKLGIDYENLKAINPELVYLSISGYGQSGPYRDRRVYDPLIQATVGTALEQHPDRPANIRSVIFDKVTGLTVAQAATTALLQRARTGRGQHLQISMLQSALYFQWPDVMWSHTLQGEGSQHHGELADYFQLYKAKDGHVAIILLADDAFAGLCKLVGCTLHEDERFLTFPDRLEHREVLKDELAVAFSDWTCADLCQHLDELSIPVAKANELQEVFADPQVLHQEAISTHEHPQAGEMKVANPPFQFEGQQPVPRRHAASLGEHTVEVLSEVGCSPEEIEALTNP